MKIFFVTLFVVIAVGYYNLSHRTAGQYFVTKDGVRLYYTDDGPKDADPVILLHGFAVNADLNWRRTGFIDRLLREGYHVIAMDLRGHGLSDHPTEEAKYGKPVADDVIELADQLGLEKFHLIGYSIGGVVAIRVAVDHPDRVLKLIPLASGWDDPDSSELFVGLKKASDDIKRTGSIEPIIGYLDESVKRSAWQSFVVRLITYFTVDRNALAPFIGQAAQLAVSKSQLGSLSIPICAIIGEKDPFLKSAELLAEIKPGSGPIVIPDANHMNAIRSEKLQDAAIHFLKTGSCG